MLTLLLGCVVRFLEEDRPDQRGEPAAVPPGRHWSDHTTLLSDPRLYLSWLFMVLAIGTGRIASTGLTTGGANPAPTVIKYLISRIHGLRDHWPHGAHTQTHDYQAVACALDKGGLPILVPFPKADG